MDLAHGLVFDYPREFESSSPTREFEWHLEQRIGVRTTDLLPWSTLDLLQEAD